jgi:hypothetical protein
MKVHCFYHRADLDGHCSGAIVRRWCGLNGHEYVPHGVDYGDDVDWLCGAGPDSMAVVCDFTPEGEAWLALQAMEELHGGGLVWIDHHETAIRSAGEPCRRIAGLRKVGTAACRLAWRHFFPGRDEPAAVRMLGRYDVFDRGDAEAWESRILPFQYGLRLSRTDPDGTDEEGLWQELLGGGPATGIALHAVLADGATCLRFERENSRRTALAAGYDCEVEGVGLCCAANARGGSLVLDAYARPEHRMRILWGFDRDKWKVHLYENGHGDVHCGEFAARHGGGGHRGAAGFTLPAGLSPLVYFEPPAAAEGGA